MSENAINISNGFETGALARATMWRPPCGASMSKLRNARRKRQRAARTRHERWTPLRTSDGSCAIKAWSGDTPCIVKWSIDVILAVTGPKRFA